MQSVRLSRVLLAAAAAALIPLAGNVIASLLTDWTGRASWLVVPLVGVIVAMIAAVVEAYGAAGSPDKGGTPLLAAIAIAVVVIGVGGLGVTEATRSLVITSADLPPGYEVARGERSSSPDTCAQVDGNPGATRRLTSGLSALGIQRCELVQYRFRDPESGNTNQPTSQVFVARDDEAAGRLVAMLRRLFLSTVDPDGTVVTRRSLPAPELGDESPRGATLKFVHPRSGKTLTYWAYWWRRGKVAAWLAVSDAVGDFDRSSTLELARAVDARITS